ncbi:class F sortase [Nocardioides zhouii]|uniref:Class F sortase n=1 Tax=Nocardioides zhouii TaxID=1168729 RepID=A0A4Q2SNT1_9ACTN|nr:class F sortase [Nocardioides zhouii]RYC07355.1 class F sortase [Nocardioides zhouii]
MRRCLVILVAIATVLVSAPAGARPVGGDEHARTAMVSRLWIPASGVNAGILPVGVTRSGQLAVGTSVRDVYRWRDGVLPGQSGSAVLAGHTWSKGRGVFDRLGGLEPGDRVHVGTSRFEVTRVRRVRDLSRRAVAALFSDEGRPRLVLITCGDRNNRTGVYRTRIIVNAKLLPRR